MVNQWLRLWHDMPTDPKWRTIARISGERIGDVMAVYLHLLVCASANAIERGRTQSFSFEDVASALDIETEQVAKIFDAMQGRVLDGDLVKGWSSRQVFREDGSAERAKAWREAKKQAKKDQLEPERTQANASEREKTPDTDTDTDTEVSLKPLVASAAADACPQHEIIELYHELIPTGRQVRLWTDARKAKLRARWREDPKRQNLDWWRKFFGYVSQSEFLSGRTQSAGRNPFEIDLEWIVTPSNFVKIVEGKYHGEEVAA